MNPILKKTLTVCLALAALAALCGPAAAQNQASSDLLLPWFEVDAANSGGLTTLFAVGNSMDQLVEVVATVHTNWGIVILEVPFTLQPREIRTVNLRNWFREGGDPKKALSAVEVQHLSAAASGKRSPKDNLYYGTEVRPGLIVGYVILRTQGNRPDALWGDWFSVDVAGNLARGDVLVNIDRSTGCPGLCQRHLLRYLSGGGFDGGTEIVIWREEVGKPSADPHGGLEMQANATALSEPGLVIEDRELALLPVEKILVSELGLQEPFGALDLVTGDDTFIAVQHSAESRYSVGLTTYCLPIPPRPGPGIDILKLTNGLNADSAPGPSLALDATVTWEYLVTNTGDVELTDVEVVDDREGAVSCPHDTLAPGESMTCTATGKAQACQYKNIGSVSALSSSGEVVDSDVSHYFGNDGAKLSIASILVDGKDAGNAANPVKVQEGEKLDWTFKLTNSGKVRLTGIQVSGIAAACGKTALEPGESTDCTATGTALAGPRSVAVVAKGNSSCAEASASGAGHYDGNDNPNETPEIEIVKLTNDADVAGPPGPAIPVGSAVTWKYKVTNKSKTLAITDIQVTDDKGVAVTCPKTSLAAGESMTCTGSGVAQACQYTNRGTVEGLGGLVSAFDDSWYYGVAYPAIKIKKATNGEDADVPQGPQVKAGSTVLWTYVVTNTGDVPLTDVKVTDNKGVAVSCPKTVLAAGESMTCTGSGIAQIGQYQNIGSVTGQPPCGNPVSDDDPSHYYGIDDPGISIVKKTNGHDANSAPGPLIEVGDPVVWQYEVKNTGKITLTGVKVTDDKGVAVSCPKTTLQPGESMTCTGQGVAQACQYQNLGTATGTPYGGGEVSASDPSHYFGQIYPAIQIKKATNGHDADTAPGPEIPVGAPVLWTYVVTNAGDVPLTGVKVTDDKGVSVACPKTSLQPGESMTCTGSGTAQAGQYRNVGAVTGQPPCGNPVSDDDPSHYWGKTEDPGLKIVKKTNGHDANAAPGPEIAAGSTVTWTYEVKNTGNVALTNLAVTDDKGVAVSCPKTTLQPGESMTCTGSGKAQACQYQNLGTVTGKTPNGQTLTASDPSHYFGKTYPAIDVETKVNGQDADTPKGPEVAVGSALSFTYVVKNTGDTTLAGIQVTDSKGVAVSCPKTTLAAGESMTCTGSGTAQAGQYSATGTASGTGACGQQVSDSDPVHYFGLINQGNEGCTPGYWKNHTDSWPPTGYSPNQNVQSVFNKASLFPVLGSSTLLQALSFNGGSTLEGAAGNLLRAATAALLNSAHSGVDYPWVTAQVISDVNAALNSQNRDTMLGLASELDQDNNLGCPLN